MIGDKITAVEGKVYRRLSDGMLFGNEIHLGMAYPSDGEPYVELPEHFEEIDDLEDSEIIIIDEATPLMGEESSVLSEEIAEHAEPAEKERVTLADYKELAKKVEMLMKTIGG